LTTKDRLIGTNGIKNVMYEFKKIPLPGESVSANTLRANAVFIYQKTKDSSVQESSEWQTSCE
jgi:hypothetical protein